MAVTEIIRKSDIKSLNTRSGIPVLVAISRDGFTVIDAMSQAITNGKITGKKYSTKMYINTIRDNIPTKMRAYLLKVSFIFPSVYKQFT